jgi:hypothetical protein
VPRQKQIAEMILPTAVSPVYPSKSIYPPYSIVESEGIPVIGMARACVKNPD